MMMVVVLLLLVIMNVVDDDCGHRADVNDGDTSCNVDSDCDGCDDRDDDDM